MPKILTHTYRARYSEIDADGRMTPANFARYIIEAAYAWGETLGLGDRTSAELGLYWVIRETEIQFFAPLHFQDEFDFTIWMLDWKRVRGTRAFVLKRTNTGELVAQGVQQIACIDSQTGRPVNPPESLIDNFRMDAPPEISSSRFPKLPALPKKPFTLEQRVAWQDLDVLEMVNNAVYIAYAEDALTRLFAAFGWSPAELKNHGLTRWIRRLHIQYQQPAVWGDVLNLAVFSLHLDQTGGSLCVDMTRLSDGAAIAACILDWSLIDPVSRTPLPLPESLATALIKTLV